jgi:nitrate reductase beta subunit
MANLFTAGDEKKMAGPLKKLMAVRIYRRWKTVGDVSAEKARQSLADTGLTEEMAEEIYAMTSLPKMNQRVVIPPAHREHAIEMLENTGDAKGSIGFGTLNSPQRGN